MLRQFSREIWKSLGMSANERAKYLKGLFLEVVRGFEPLLYLDVGAGLGYNSFVFGEDAGEILAVDLRFPKNNVLKNVGKVHMVVADACFLPFRSGLFDTVSMFSVIEHVSNQKAALKEVIRVLKSDRYLIVQIPNKFFPIELHSGLPFVFLFPLKVRGTIFEWIGHAWLGKINVPSIKKLKGMIFQIQPRCDMRVKKVIYPSSVIWSKLRFFYKFALKTKILDIAPLGYLLVVKNLI